MADTFCPRWVGSKRLQARALAPSIRAHLKRTGGRVISPFYGMGHVERAVGADTIAADACEPLRLMWWFAVTEPEALHAALVGLDGMTGRDPDVYDHVRKLKPTSPVQLAARFMWLNLFSFQGLHRVNKDGVFNAPANKERLAKTALPTLEQLRAMARNAPRHWHLDWSAALACVRAGDVVVSDPPYVGTFDSYTAKSFTAADHEALAYALLQASSRDVAILAFNSTEGGALYQWADELRVTSRPGTVSSKGSGRKRVAESLAIAGLLP